MLLEDLPVSPESVPERALMPVVHHVGVLHGSLDSPMPSERLSGCTVWPSELHLACLCRPDCFGRPSPTGCPCSAASIIVQKQATICPASLALWPWHRPALTRAASQTLATACPGRSSCPGLGNCPGPGPRPGLSIRPGSVSCHDWSLSLAFGLHLDARTHGEFNKLLAYFRTDCKMQHN